LLTSSRPDLWGSGPKAREVFLNRYQPPVLIKKKMRRGGREFESIIPMQGKPIRETELQLRLRGSGSFVRRLKRDTDLPPKFRTPLDVPVRLSKQDKEMLREAEADLDAIVGRVNGDVKAGQSKEAGAVIDAISLVDPDVPDFSELARVRRNLGLVKAPHCAKFIMDELEEEKDMAPENRTKTVVFAHHKEVISKIHEEAEKRMKGAVLVYDGSSGSARKRQEIIDRFQSDDDVRGIIISLAGATGITLTAGARMRVVEPDWTPSNMIQIEDRIWRIGQESNVDIGYMSVAGTLDARVGTALVEKMESDEKSMNTISFKNAKKPEDPRAEIPEETEAATNTSDDDAQPSLPL
jgi:SNF2 family DNA or RNA helicase